MFLHACLQKLTVSQNSKRGHFFSMLCPGIFKVDELIAWAFVCVVELNSFFSVRLAVRLCSFHSVINLNDVHVMNLM